ncbi:MAG: CotH kinase family protein, partial [Spirochaetia bacterium]|nr:CotH kinase family protein [Spirochaetia bacterium]
MLSKVKLILAFITVCLLTSCGEFGGFSDFSKADTGSITKVEAYFTEENLAKFYDSVSQPEEDYAQCTVTMGKNTYQGWMKVRGYTSRGEPKKNFTLRIKVGNKKVKYALMHEADTWFKNRIVMYAYNNYIYKGAALTAAPETEPVALFVNEKYIGYYARVDMYDESQLNAYKKGSSSELFKILINDFVSDPPHERSEKKFPKDKNFSSLDLL